VIVRGATGRQATLPGGFAGLAPWWPHG